MDNPRISVLITAYKEAGTIGKSIECIAEKKYSGIWDDFEILLACPDQETYQAALSKIDELGVKDKFRFVQDPGKGKPAALNMLMEQAKGDVWIFTDGDVYFGPQAVAKLMNHFENLPTSQPLNLSTSQPQNFSTSQPQNLSSNQLLMVTGRPRSADKRESMMAYFGHLLSDAANHKRNIDLTANPEGKSLKFVKKRAFFPVSGYIYAMTRTDARFPEDTLVDDAYISYIIHNSGGRIEYEPEAEAFVKYPTNLNDYFKQKKRSTGGYMQLWEYGVVKPETKTRSFWRELEYFWFPLTYAKNLKEFFWSLLLYPIRLWLWVQIYWERKIQKKDFVRTWVRVESTK